MLEYLEKYANDEDEYYYLLAYYLLKEKIKMKKMNQPLLD